MAKVDIYSVPWCDLVFIDRNTSFGAYVLRTESSFRHLKALFIASVVFLLAIASPVLLKSLAPSVDDSDTSVREFTYVDPNVDNEKEKPTIELPPPPERLSTIAFPPPVILEDELVAEETDFNQQTVINSESVIANETVVGTTTNVDEVVVNNIDDTARPETIESIVDQKPQFPGGDGALMDWLNDNIVYPAIPKENGVQGKVTVEFVVGKDGLIRDVKVVGNIIDDYLVEEAERLVKAMPKWSPGVKKNQVVSSRFYLPITFLLKE